MIRNRVSRAIARQLTTATCVGLFVACSSSVPEAERVGASSAAIAVVVTVDAATDAAIDGPPQKRCDGTPNGDHPKYACPEKAPVDASGRPLAGWCTAKDGGNYDHIGNCFREIPPPTSDGSCPGGQQCCYGPDGLDNCSGSYDVCEPAVGQQSDGSCKWSFGYALTHCQVDVLPFCKAHKQANPKCEGGGACNGLSQTTCGTTSGCAWGAYCWPMPDKSTKCADYCDCIPKKTKSVTRVCDVADEEPDDVMCAVVDPGDLGP